MKEDELKERLEERLRDYVGWPNIDVVRQSITEEILEEVEKDDDLIERHET